MIQIYKPTNTNYDHNGDYVLSPLACIFECEINGEWELELEHVADENAVELIKADAVISAPTGIKGIEALQLFRIYKTEKDMNTIIAYARPVFLDAANDCFIIDSRPTEKTGQQALDILCSYNSKYSGRSDITNLNTAYYIRQNLIEALNGKGEMAFLKRWGGEILYNNHQVMINMRVGGDYGARAEFGYNLTGIEEKVNTSEVITRIVPIAFNGIMLNAPYYVDSDKINCYPFVHTRLIKYEHVKLASDVEGEPGEEDAVFDTVAKVQAELIRLAKLEFSNGIDLPEVTYKVEIADIAQADLYKDIKDLVDISLGDTVSCVNKKLDITTVTRCIGLTYDCISERIKTVRLGDASADFIDKFSSVYNAVTETVNIKDNTIYAEKIFGILDASKAQLKCQNGIAKKQDVRAILFEDMDPESPNYGAVCIGSMGIQIADRRTTDGKDWDWETAITAKGMIAEAIKVGFLSASRIYGGTLKLGGSQNNNGLLELYNSSGKLMANITNEGFKVFGDNGEYTVINKYGPQHYDGSLKRYHYLSTSGTVTVSGRTSNVTTTTVQLPDEFKGKDFMVIASIAQSQVGGGHEGNYMEATGAVAGNKNIAKGTFDVQLTGSRGFPYIENGALRHDRYPIVSMSFSYIAIA